MGEPDLSPRLTTIEASKTEVIVTPYKETTTPSQKTVTVGANGKAPPGLKAGTNVVTAGGTYRITSVNKDGTYNKIKAN